MFENAMAMLRPFGRAAKGGEGRQNQAKPPRTSPISRKRWKRCASSWRSSASASDFFLSRGFENFAIAPNAACRFCARPTREAQDMPSAGEYCSVGAGIPARGHCSAPLPRPPRRSKAAGWSITTPRARSSRSLSRMTGIVRSQFGISDIGAKRNVIPGEARPAQREGDPGGSTHFGSSSGSPK
jgi:hypothetical protein